MLNKIIVTLEAAGRVEKAIEAMFEDEQEGEAEDNWMDTYADAITLLMAFFVVLLAMSSMDKKI